MSINKEKYEMRLNMGQIFYRPKDGWVGDTIPFAHDGKFYIFISIPFALLKAQNVMKMFP